MQNFKCAALLKQDLHKRGRRGLIFLVPPNAKSTPRKPTQLRAKGEEETMFLFPVYLSYHTFSAKISDAKTKYTVVNSGLHQPLK